jgi:1-aminocyclopropane-1-carboxylate deaminase
MKLIFVDRESYRDKQKLFDWNFKNDPNAFFINEGGASPEAAHGCAELVEELKADYRHLFCSCGTGTTAAGIMNGLSKINSSTLFHAVSALKGDYVSIKIFTTYKAGAFKSKFGCGTCGC